jgi:hypothetical protein
MFFITVIEGFCGILKIPNFWGPGLVAIGPDDRAGPFNLVGYGF